MNLVWTSDLLCRKNAGYGVESGGECSTDDGVCEAEGIIREGTLAEGPLMDGVFTEAAAEERVLSRDLERFDDGVGDVGTVSGVDIFSGLAPLPAPLRAPLRRRARNLCSLKTICWARVYIVVCMVLLVFGLRTRGELYVANVSVAVMAARMDCFCKCEAADFIAGLGRSTNCSYVYSIRAYWWNRV